MKLAQIEPVAQEIVNATAPLVGHTVNIMDTAGKIIASSDHDRVGSFHQGAAEVLERRTAVRIFPADLPRYPGAKEGVNLPIIKNDKLLGVVGILGNPVEVEAAANLLGVYVGIYLDQASAVRRDLLRREMRLVLLGQLLSGTADADKLIEAGHELSLNIRLPIRVIAVRISAKDKLRRIQLLDRTEELLLSVGLIDAVHDVYGVSDGMLFLLKQTSLGFKADAFLQQLYNAVKETLSCEAVVSIGGESVSFPEIAQSRDEALALGAMKDVGCANIEDAKQKSVYLLGCMDAEVLGRFLAPMYQALFDGFGGHIDWVIATIEAYCTAEYSVTKAADALHIHKNTLLYRVKKILSLMGLEEEQSFTREFFLKLLLVYHRRLSE